MAKNFFFYDEPFFQEKKMGMIKFTNFDLLKSFNQIFFVGRNNISWATEASPPGQADWVLL